MEIPAGIPNCPPGLEYLTQLDQLLIKQKVNLAQVLVGFEQNNKFVVKNSLGQDVSCHLLSPNSMLSKSPFLISLQNVWWRCTWRLKTLIAVHATVAVRFARSIWKCWICIRMRSSISIGHWLVQAVAFHAVCNHWRFHRLPAMWLDASNRSGLAGIQISALKTIWMKPFCGLKDHSARCHVATMSISM